MEYTPPLTRSGTTFELDPAHELSNLPPLWAIPNLIPCHRLSLIVAPSGTGLTTLACTLAASLAPALPQFLDGTAGVSPARIVDPSPQPQLDDSPQQPPDPNIPSYEIVNNHYASPPPTLHDSPIPSVLLITDRDHPDVLKPRLKSLGADLQRVLILSKVYHHHDSPDGHTPPMDTAEPFAAMDHNELSELLHEHRGIRLVLIDNAELLFSDYNRPSRSRIQRQLSLLQAVANKREVAIVLLTSIPRIGTNPFRSALLATFNEVCRRVFLLAPDPQSESHRYLFCLKNTLTTPVPTLQLRLFGSPASRSCNLQSPIPNLQSSPSSLTYSTYLQLTRLRPGPIPHARLLAQKFLTELLSKGALPVGNHKKPPDNSIRAQVIAAGLSWATIRRAASEMNLSIFRDADCWYWQLQSIPTPVSGPTPVESVLPPVELAPPTCAPSQLPANDQQPMTIDDKATCAPSNPTPADPPLIANDHPQGVAA